MNVIVVADSASISGGMQKCAVWSAIELAHRGHRVTYLAGYGPVDKAFEGTGVEVVCFNYDDRPARADKRDALKRVFGNAETGAAMDKILADLSPVDTVVHCHDVDRIVTMRPIQIALWRGFPVVMTLHTYGLACPTGSFFNFVSESVCPLRPMSAACISTECTGHGRATKMGHVAKFALNRFKGIPGSLRDIIFVSEFSRQKHLPYLPKEAHHHVIANHVDVVPGEMVDCARNQWFTYVGRVVPEKGPAVLAEAARKLGVPVKFVGDGPDKERVLAANPDAVVTGWLPPEEVHKHLAQARCLCMVSRWYEGQPLVVAEALAKGLPVIVSDVCAAQEVVTDGETGLLFHSGDSDDLAAKMRLVLDDDTAARMGETAYDRFWESPQTLEKHVSELLRVYEQALTR